MKFVGTKIFQSTVERKNEIHVLSPKRFVHSLIVFRDVKKKNNSMACYTYILTYNFFCIWLFYITNASIRSPYSLPHLWFVLNMPTYSTPLTNETREIAFLKENVHAVAEWPHENCYIVGTFPRRLIFPEWTECFDSVYSVGHTHTHTYIYICLCVCLCCMLVTWPSST